MQADRQDILKRLNYIEGHLRGIRKMVEDDVYCVDILRQTFAVRKAIEKMEALMLEQHLHHCVPKGIKEGREAQVIDELVQLYNLAGVRGGVLDDRPADSNDANDADAVKTDTEATAR
ncbi:MAG: metal-sensitive transcriptional regulator [Ktedonobacterales bacterium]